MRRENRHKKRRQAEQKVFVILFSITFMLTGSLLFYITSQGRETKGSVGDVAFSLTEPLGDKLYTDGSTVQVAPGQRLAKDPTITLKKGSKPAYIRARILFGGLNASMRKALEEQISVKSGWIQNPGDGYYYYQYPVTAEQSVCFFEAVTIPEEWSERSERIRFYMEVEVQAAEIGCIETTWNQQQKIIGWT